LIDPQSRGSVAKAKFVYPVKQQSNRRMVVREKSARYRKK